MPARPRCFHRYLVELTLIGIWVALLTLPVAAQSTLTPEPTLTPTLTPEPNLLLIAQPESLTLVVKAETVNLTGFGFGVPIGGEIVVIELADRVDALVLLGNIAPAGACFQFVVSGESPVLPSDCTNTVYLYRVQVAPSDQFWYDRLANRLRDIGIFQSGELTGRPCGNTSLEVGCEVTWDESIIPTPTPTATVDVQATNRAVQATPLPTLTPVPVVQPTQVVTQSYPCAATISTAFTNVIYDVRPANNPNASPVNRRSINAGEGVQILDAATEGNDPLYRFRDSNGIEGWIPERYVVLSAVCPTE
jgi:hypothetical protein